MFKLIKDVIEDERHRYTVGRAQRIAELTTAKSVASSPATSPSEPPNPISKSLRQVSATEAHNQMPLLSWLNEDVKFLKPCSETSPRAPVPAEDAQFVEIWRKRMSRRTRHQKRHPRQSPPASTSPNQSAEAAYATPCIATGAIAMKSIGKPLEADRRAKALLLTRAPR